MHNKHTMDRACEKGSFMENRDYKTTVANNKKETNGISRADNEEGRFGEFNTYKVY